MENFNSWQQLDEKLILYNNGQKYGQIVFVVGGAGSGKGFAISNFMEKEKFKVRDVDEWKKAFIKMDAIFKDAAGVQKNLGTLNLRNPKDVALLHRYVSELGIKDKTLTSILNNARNPETLPNIIFDITGKKTKEIVAITPKLIAAGYKPENIHVTWVLTDYQLAFARNASRERVVPGDIMIKTHIGAAHTMARVAKGRLPRGVRGGIYVILNNRENTIPWTDASGKVRTSKTTGDVVVKDFTYLTLKEPGEKLNTGDDVQKQLYRWIKNNVPRAALNRIDKPKV